MKNRYFYVDSELESNSCPIANKKTVIDKKERDKHTKIQLDKLNNILKI